MNEDSKQHQRIGAAVLFLLLFLAVAPFAYGRYVRATNPPLGGNVYLTLRSNTPGHIASIFRFGKDRRLELFLNDGKLNITGSLSADGRTMAYVSMSPGEQAGHITTLDLSTGEKKILTKGGTRHAREPKWSPQGDLIVFTAMPEGTSAFSYNPEDWNVYVTDLNGKEVLIGAGTHPQWSPDGSGILALRADGLHLYGSKGGTREKVLDVPGTTAASINYVFDVSNDGKRMALMDAANKIMLVNTIASWSPFVVEPYRTIPMHAFGVAFSPEARAIAVTEIQGARPQLSLYNLTTGSVRLLVDLSRYDQMQMFLSDWK